MQSHTCTASRTLSFRCDSVPLDAIRSRSLSCLVHRRPFPALVSLGCYIRKLKIKCGESAEASKVNWVK
ncbi:hypothetical protein MTR_0088s0030 [Medicago truncatula]|uniref:Uncharacterized protein n=1 Tax=Medicago truncatula TaxID=3880 RepID=A0A072THD1_MEDTR|nr:hypothetical protein MTR_0088s0030 [Medicago truncatula]